MRIDVIVLSGLLLAARASDALGSDAAVPECIAPERLLVWPESDPVWMMCWLPPEESAGPRGSGLELRKVHYRGHPVLRRAHAPMLFAEYREGAGGDCYRDWKDQSAPILADIAVQGRLDFAVDPPQAITACDRSRDPTQSYGACPFRLDGYPNANATCHGGVAIEDRGDRVMLTSQYYADWYLYTSRWTFHADGRIEPVFGFGNSNGTFNSVTHWHHNYWRLEFDIDGVGNDVVSRDGIDRATEFSDVRDPHGSADGESRTWAVRNPVSGRGYRIVPGDTDYRIATDESGRGFHLVDVMVTRQHDLEYGDSPNYDLWDCAMDQAALVDGESIERTVVAFYYRAAVRDTTKNDWPPGCIGGACVAQDSMLCKQVGPVLVPLGHWEASDPRRRTPPEDLLHSRRR